MAINTNLKITNIEVDEKLKEYLAKRLTKLEQFIDKNDTSAIADIELEKRSGQNSGKIYRAEINLKIAGSYLRVEDEAEAIRDAIDLMQEEMIRRLRKTKQKKRGKIRSGARKMKKMIQGLYNRRDADKRWYDKLRYNMGKREVSTSPRALQHIAFAAVVLFGLVMTYAIHVTSKTVADVKANHNDLTQQILQEAQEAQRN